MKKTEWFPIVCLPVHEGVYETAISSRELEGGIYQRYEGGKWYSTGDTVIEAADCPFESAISEFIIYWRGLTEKSE